MKKEELFENGKMNASDIKAGSKQRIKIGKNEVEVSVLGKKGKTWLVESSSGKKFPVGESRFIKNEKSEAKPKVVKSTQNPQDLKPQVSGLKPKMSMLGAAIEVLKDASHPMSAKEMIEAMEEADLWISPKGKTPWNSLASAINREITNKENPRFKKAERGKFALNSGT